jgi:uncharacterized damage-inducible protein DinB
MTEIREEEVMSQTARLADQIQRAYYGEAWHGDPIQDILTGVNAEVAAVHPFRNAHSIWEIVLHMAAWDDAVRRRTTGQTVNLTDKENFPPIPDKGEAAWRAAMDHLKKTHDELVKAVSGFPDDRLQEQVPGKREPYYNYYYMFSGIVQHELYHAGQIVMLKKAHSLEHAPHV